MSSVNFYTQSPFVVFEVQWTGDNLADIQAVVTDATAAGATLTYPRSVVFGPGDPFTASTGQWIAGQSGIGGAPTDDPQKPTDSQFQAVPSAGPLAYTITETS